MRDPGHRRDLILFSLIAIVVAILALVAYRMSGPLGIEERFSRTVELPGTEGEAGGGWFGFSLEGNPAAYGIVLGSLVLLSLFAFFRGRRLGKR